MTRQFIILYKIEFMDWISFSPHFEYEDCFKDFDYPWAGQKYFIYDLVRNFRPSEILVLGNVEQGSLLPFCQALKEGQIEGELTAIEFPRNDIDGVFSGEPFGKKVEEIIALYYPSLKIKLLRTTREKALTGFSNNALDILLIDGLRTFEEIKRDFYSWVDLVKEDGIILFHNRTHHKDTEVTDFWEMVNEKYMAVKFSPSFGLGVIFKNSHIQIATHNLQNFWQRYYSLTSENSLLRNELKEKNLEILNLEKSLRQIEYDLEHYPPVIVELMNQVTDLETALKTIHDSSGWKLLLRYYRTWDRLLPANTERRMRVRNRVRKVFKKILNPR